MSDEADSLPVPELHTSRLVLRHLAEDDAPGLHQAFGDAVTMRFWDSPPTADIAATRERIRFSRTADPAVHAAFAVLTRGDCGFVGMANYHARRPAHRRLGVGWILRPQCRGQGYAAEAMGALLGHCFAALDSHRIEAEIAPDNAASIRLDERLGFRREGLLRDRLWVAGEPRSIWMYALLRPEWQSAGNVTSVRG